MMAPSVRLVGEQRGDRHVGVAAQHVLGAGERVAGYVEPEHLPLEPEQLLARPLLARVVEVQPYDAGGHVVVGLAEQVELAAVALALDPDHRVDGDLVVLGDRAAGVAETVERAGLGQ